MGSRRAPRAGVAATSAWHVGLASALVAAVVLGTFGVGGAHRGLSASPRFVPSDPPSIGPCSGDLPTDGVNGVVEVVGGSLAPAWADGLALNYTFDDRYQTFYVGNFTVLSQGCVLESGTTTTSDNGSFRFVPQAPTSTCVPNGTICTAYYPPEAPVYLRVAGGLPPGYAQNASSWYPPITLEVVDELAGVTVSSASSSFSTSVGAPLTLSASAWAANGTPTPLPSSFAWTVNGTGWSLDSPASGVSVNLSAVPGAGVGTVAVRADAEAHGIELPSVATSATLVAVATAIQTGQANRTAIDAGNSLGFGLTAVGAAGFAYTATVAPGLGLPSAAAPCTTSSGGEGVIDLRCSANVVYPTAGTAQPTAAVTNGYSTGDWQFPDVLVNPPPELETSPAAPVGYALAPVGVTITAANGSGTEPYQRACLDPGDGPVLCEGTPGPSWSFAPIFPTPGTYDAVAWAVDADGANVSLAFPVSVVAPLSVGPVTTGSGTATVGAPLELRANVSGGVLPLRYWWNSSASDGPLLDGSLAADGSLNLTWVPDVAGPFAVTLTVVDGLGTAVATSDLVQVGAAAAERLAAVTAPPAGPVTVGSPVPLTWGAFTSAGALDASFAASLELTVRTATGAPEAWVNASGAGTLGALGNGTYGVPASAWVGGLLSVNLTVATAGDVTIALSGAGLPALGEPMRLVAEPQLRNVRLFDPMVARAGARTNATLWHVEDAFGNAASGALLTIALAFGSERSESVVAAVPLPGGGSGAWVNYTAPSSGAGVVTVTDAAGAVVLGPIAVPMASARAPAVTPVDALATVVPVAAAGAAGFTVARRRRRRRAPGAATERELRQFAEGRARTVELVRRAGAADLAGLEAAWEPAPAPRELADWIASLVADGTLGATLGEDGVARFCLADRGTSSPRPTFDREALELSLRRRDEALAEDEEERPSP